jgi:hypothetical protein
MYRRRILVEHEVPGATILPGLNANYRRGRTTQQLSKAHETVGNNSTDLIRNRGLCQILLPKARPAEQFAPLNATCSDACEFGPLGFGIEIERMVWGPRADQRDPITSIQVEWYARVIVAGKQQLGTPYEAWHLGWAEGQGRLPVGTNFRGVVNHGACTHYACDQHTDGVFPHERDMIMAKVAELGGGGSVTKRGRGVESIVFDKNLDGKTYTAHLVRGDAIVATWSANPGAYGIPGDCLRYMEKYQQQNGFPIERCEHGDEVMAKIKKVSAAAGIPVS